MHNGLRWNMNHHPLPPAYPQQVQSHQSPLAYQPAQYYQSPPAYQPAQYYQSPPAYQPAQYYQSPPAYQHQAQHFPNIVYNSPDYQRRDSQPNFRSPPAVSPNRSPQRAGQGIFANPGRGFFGVVFNSLVPKVIKEISPDRKAIISGTVSKHAELFETPKSNTAREGGEKDSTSIAPESNKNVSKNHEALKTAGNLTQTFEVLSTRVKDFLTNSQNLLSKVPPEASKNGSVPSASPPIWSESIIKGGDYSGHSSPSVGQDGGQSNSPSSPNSYLSSSPHETKNEGSNGAQSYKIYTENQKKSDEEKLVKRYGNLLYAFGGVGSDRASTPKSSSPISRFSVNQETQTDPGENNEVLLKRVTNIEDFQKEVLEQQKTIIDKQKIEILSLKQEILAIKSSEIEGLKKERYTYEKILRESSDKSNEPLRNQGGAKTGYETPPKRVSFSGEPSPSRSPTPSPILSPIGDVVESPQQPKR